MLDAETVGHIGGDSAVSASFLPATAQGSSLKSAPTLPFDGTRRCSCALKQMLSKEIQACSPVGVVGREGVLLVI